jgi:hypothetical protein
MPWIVKLEPGVWLADGKGDPPRTVVQANAKRFRSVRGAVVALKLARRCHPFVFATVQEQKAGDT